MSRTLGAVAAALVVLVAPAASVAAAPADAHDAKSAAQGGPVAPTPLQTPTDVYAIALKPPPPLPPLPPPGSPPEVIGRAHAARAAAMQGTDQWEEIGSRRSVRNVSRATITPVLPDVRKATGAAVIVVPGGAFLHLEIDRDGYKVARWLADRGIAAIVLKYRTEHTPADPHQFMVAQAERDRQVKSDAQREFPGAAILAEDIQDAMSVARKRANEIGVDPRRIGVLGFASAGAALVSFATGADAALRPAFVATVDSSLKTRAVPGDAPPLFVAISGNDSKSRQADSSLVKAWRQSKATAALHVYQRDPQFSPDRWGKEFVRWLTSRGFLQSAK
jgi:acetyl esterase/lipase